MIRDSPKSPPNCLRQVPFSAALAIGSDARLQIRHPRPPSSDTFTVSVLILCLVALRYPDSVRGASVRRSLRREQPVGKSAARRLATAHLGTGAPRITQRPCTATLRFRDQKPSRHARSLRRFRYASRHPAHGFEGDRPGKACLLDCLWIACKTANRRPVRRKRVPRLEHLQLSPVTTWIQA